MGFSKHVSEKIGFDQNYIEIKPNLQDFFRKDYNLSQDF